MDNQIYKYILLINLIGVLSELFFTLICYFFPKNLFLIGLFKRLFSLSILLFFLALGYYIFLIAINSNEEEKNKFDNSMKKNIPWIMTILVIVIGVFQFILPIEFFYGDNGYIDYVAGFCTNPYATVVAIIIISYVAPKMIKNWKTIDKKKLSPFFIVMILEFITLIINSIDPSLCVANFSLTMTCYLMYFTMENPDLKVIATLELAKSQAEKANNAKSDFLSSMSHEIRTPLNAIVGLSQMIKYSDSLEQVHKDSDDIFVASQNLLDIVNGILDISKLESNKMEIVEDNYKPQEVLDDLIHMMNIRIGDKPLEIRSIFKNLPEELYGDKEKIKQIISNLLTNAIKYTDKGFIDFNVNCENNKDKCLLNISVRDTGRGISDEQMAKLFSKFNRLESDKDSDIGGTGLGLAITKSLVDLLDGVITVDSIYGQGSVFTVTLSQKIVTNTKEKEEVL